jgi:hypothetical protein
MTDLEVERERTDLPDWLVGAGIDEGRGLEIGPLDKPRLTKDRYRVEYVDHAPTEALRVKYADDDHMADHLDEIVEVDHVWGGDVPLATVVADGVRYDYVFASHVVEHVPDVIGWLDQLASVLADGGKVCLAIPDKRLCFDVNRGLTQMSDLVDAHLRGLHAPSYRQIYDFHSQMVAVDAGALWAGTADYAGVWRDDLDPDAWAYELCERARDGEYVDGHCHVFTPASFLDLYARLVALDLIAYRIFRFVPSLPGTIEFRVVLEKLPDSMDPAERRRVQLASIPTFVDTVPPPGSGVVERNKQVVDDEGDPARVTMDISVREASFLRRKRQLLGVARSALTRVRGAASR